MCRSWEQMNRLRAQPYWTVTRLGKHVRAHVAAPAVSLACSRDDGDRVHITQGTVRCVRPLPGFHQLQHSGGVAGDKAFTYDGVFDEQASQEKVYAALGRPVLHDVLAGMHGCGASPSPATPRITQRGETIICSEGGDSRLGRFSLRGV